MKKPAQLPLSLSFPPALSQEEFIVSEANANAFAFIDRWPDWTVPVAAIYGPAGSGKTHLASIWCQRSGATLHSARDLRVSAVQSQAPRVIEDIDAAEPTDERDSVLFAALQRACPDAPLLLTGLVPPSGWQCTLPDLASRFCSLVAVAVHDPDERVLEGLAQKLFADRQLPVPDDVIAFMLRVLERSPAALREFVAEADAVALAEARPLNLYLVRRLLAARKGTDFGKSTIGMRSRES